MRIEAEIRVVDLREGQFVARWPFEGSVVVGDFWGNFSLVGLLAVVVARPCCAVYLVFEHFSVFCLFLGTLRISVFLLVNELLDGLMDFYLSFPLNSSLFQSSEVV